MKNFTRSLHTLWTIFKQEFSMYWISPIAYIVGAMWLFFSGLFFSLNLIQLNQSSGGFSFFGGMTPNQALTETLSPMVFLLLFLAPALTMRVVADEIRSGTHELLLTSPVRDWEIIVGKWLAVWGVFSVFIVISFIYPLILIWRGTPDMTGIWLSYLGYWLWSGTVLAVGVLASSLTQFQLIAFLISEGVGLFFLLATAMSQFFSNNQVLSTIFGQITISTHFQDTMLRGGVLRFLDLGYFAAMIAICLFLATQVLNSRRWRA